MLNNKDSRSFKINFDVKRSIFVKHFTSTIMCLSLPGKLHSNEELEIAVRELLRMQEPELYRDGICNKRNIPSNKTICNKA
jgi:hypothetical protein